MSKRSSVLVRFGNRVRALRHDVELSQEAFAHKCGLDRTYVSGVERGKRNVSLKNIELIAKAFRVSISTLTENL